MSKYLCGLDNHNHNTTTTEPCMYCNSIHRFITAFYLIILLSCNASTFLSHVPLQKGYEGGWVDTIYMYTQYVHIAMWTI